MYFNKALSTISYTTKSDLLEYFAVVQLLIRVTKMPRNKSQLFKVSTWFITLVCHWSTLKFNKMQNWFFVLLRHYFRTYSILHGYFSFGKTRKKATGNEILLLVVYFNILITNPTKWSNTLKQFVGILPTNCLSVFDHFVKLVLQGLRLGVRLLARKSG